MRWLALVLLCGAAHAAEPRVEMIVDADDEARVKKSAWLAEKAERGASPAVEPQQEPEHPLSLHNLWSDETWPLPSTLPEEEAQRVFDEVTRCHFTRRTAHMAPALLPLVRRAAETFKSPVVEIVSGFRAPKYQLMLRKKGHEVARDSEHPRGEAVDFRLPNTPTKKLLGFVRAQRLGGVGYYPVSQFVHADVGPIRYWKGH